MLRLLLQDFILHARLLLCAASVHEQDEPGAEQRRIREIRIDIASRYTEEQAKDSSWKSFTNRHNTPMPVHKPHHRNCHQAVTSRCLWLPDQPIQRMPGNDSLPVGA